MIDLAKQSYYCSVAYSVTATLQPQAQSPLSAASIFYARDENCPFFCLSTYLFMYLFINLLIYSFIHLSMYKINCFDILISNFVGDFIPWFMPKARWFRDEYISKAY